MSSRIRIGSSERPLAEANESWIQQQINDRKRDGNVCVQVFLEEAGVHMTLSTPGCSGGGGGGRAPNRLEQELFDLWSKLHLGQTNFSVGNIIAFLKQLRKILT